MRPTRTQHTHTTQCPNNRSSLFITVGRAEGIVIVVICTSRELRAQGATVEVSTGDAAGLWSMADEFHVSIESVSHCGIA